MMGKFLPVLALALLFGLAGCSGSYSRGQFQGHVVGKTETEIVSNVGKPDEIDTKDAARPRWIYKAKTFDPDNFNQVDQRVTVILEKDAQGKLVARDVLFGS